MVHQLNVSPINLSLCGCGFLGVYHVGVVSAFKEHAPEVLNGKMAGCSAGSLVAACAMCGCCLGQMCSDALEIAIRARSRALGPLHPTFNIVDIIRNGLRRILPTDAHIICSGRLYISLTRWKDNKNVVVNQFDSREELIQVLICSSFVPYWSGIIPPKFREIYYWDGGLTNNNPIIDNGTILVSPFAGESDICPRDESGSFYSVDFRGTDISMTQENLFRMTHALFPPNITILKQICWHGYSDGLKFLQTRNVLKSSYLSTKLTISSVLGNEYTEPANDEENQLRNGGIDEDIEQMYENIGDIEEESAQEEEHSNDSASQSDEESNAASSQAEFSAYCTQVVRKKELPAALFATFADAKQKEEDPIRRYFTDTYAYHICSLMALPFTLPVDFSYATTKRVLRTFRPSSNVEQASMPRRAINYLLSFFSDDNSDNSTFHVHDCECKGGRVSSVGCHELKQQMHSYNPPSSSPVDPNRKNLKRKRQKSVGISTVTSYQTDSLSGDNNDGTSTINNGDTIYFSSETHLNQQYSQPDLVMSADSKNRNKEYCHQLQQMAKLSNIQQLNDQTSSTSQSLFNNDNSYMTNKKNELETIHHETQVSFN